MSIDHLRLAIDHGGVKAAKRTTPTYDQKSAMQALGMSYGPFMRQYRAGEIPVCFKKPKDGSWPRGGRAPKAAIDRLAAEGRRPETAEHGFSY